ncbi:MAG: PD-(D/E)XK nuclease family protein [Puniceicoccales bacterium]|jgi:hypothetical protein|nr:PD-(D/E)XK nuclease family protein [Puniceicoccales bacterium]
MPGFISNHFASIEKHLLQEIHSAEKFPELSSLILCHSPIEIEFLKQFFSAHQCPFDNFYFHTFDAFTSEILNKFLPECPITSLSDLKFLAHNKQFRGELPILSQFFLEENFETQRNINPNTFAALQSLKQQIQELDWQTPQQALKKITNYSSKLFQKCILFGFSSRDHFYTSLLKLLQKIAHHVTFFTFDCGDSELVTIELLEKFFGPAENIREIFPKYQPHFAIVDDPIDAATYIQQLISFQKTQENTGIVCLSPSFATLVAHNLETSHIPFYNNFPTPIVSARDNLVFTWRQWQMKNDRESFIQFYNFLQYLDPNLSSQRIDIYKVLKKIFADYPALHVQDLADYSKNPFLKNILEHYPMLPENGLLSEFVNKTNPVIPEIAKIEKYFPQNFPVTREAFLNYAFDVYLESKPSLSKVHAASTFLLDPLSASQLVFDKIIVFFQDISNSIPFPTSSLQAKNVHFIALKSNISPNFIECYQAYTGKILDPSAMQSITKYFPQKEISQNHRKLYDSLKKIHQARNDENLSFGAFECTIPEIQNYPLPITAIERAYAEPEEIWYRYVLKNDRPQLLFEKSKFEGILSHDFLRWPNHSFPSFQSLQQYIFTRKQFFQQKFANILSQTLIQEAIESSEIRAYIIAKKLTAFEHFPFIINEVDLHAPITLSDGNSIPLHGRIDCILSQYPFRKTFHRDNASNNILLVDFKTGTTSQNDLQKLVKTFTNLPQSLTGLQLVLYGLMLRSLGYQNIQLLILNGDPYDHGEPLRLEMIIASENFKFIQKYLKILLVDGIFGHSQPHPFSKTCFSPPIATLSPNSKIIQSKREQLFS